VVELWLMVYRLKMDAPEKTYSSASIALWDCSQFNYPSQKEDN
jgi:hypothetical protein